MKLNQVTGVKRDPSKNILALVSMIIGICSVVVGFILLFIPLGLFIGFILSVVAVVLGIKSLNSEDRGFAITGIATGGFAGLIYGILIMIKLVAVGLIGLIGWALS